MLVFRGRARLVAVWVTTSFALNLAWEAVQLPLYTIFSEGSAQSIVYAVTHCTLGDVVIALACYVGAGLAMRNVDWVRVRPFGGTAVAVVLGTAYTVFSEWLNVSVRGSWAYAASMPVILGIGITPLLQWVVVPALSVAMIRRLTLP